ncbi:hypothetical protein [Pseudonocardia alni]|uniref:hypothetical protein n=1 Tax=Pseudonocardia alni TaxID=33907 RepID=UPI00280C0A1C|nr:hypothetical protein [Pseudonocardia alni]
MVHLDPDNNRRAQHGDVNLPAPENAPEIPAQRLPDPLPAPAPVVIPASAPTTGPAPGRLGGIIYGVDGEACRRVRSLIFATSWLVFSFGYAAGQIIPGVT